MNFSSRVGKERRWWGKAWEFGCSIFFFFFNDTLSVFGASSNPPPTLTALPDSDLLLALSTFHCHHSRVILWACKADFRMGREASYVSGNPAQQGPLLRRCPVRLET